MKTLNCDILPGDVLYWLDPDESLCSGWVEVVKINTLSITVLKAGVEFKVLPDELFSHEI